MSWIRIVSINVIITFVCLILIELALSLTFSIRDKYFKTEENLSIGPNVTSETIGFRQEAKNFQGVIPAGFALASCTRKTFAKRHRRFQARLLSPGYCCGKFVLPKPSARMRFSFTLQTPTKYPLMDKARSLERDKSTAESLPGLTFACITIR